MTKLVIVINGRPRAGKDTVVEYMMDALNDMGVLSWEMSSIDPVRELLAPVSNFKAKTEADRLLLAEVGRAVENHSGWRTKQVIDFVGTVFATAGEDDAAAFIHMREPDLIEKLRTLLAASPLDTRLLTLFVDKPNAAAVTSNLADAGVEGMAYDLRLSNAGDLYDLRRAATYMAAKLFMKMAA